MEELETAVQPVKKKKWWILWSVLVILLLLEGAAVGYLYLPDAWTYIRHGVRTVRSGIDYDHDLLDDAKDMMLGALRALLGTENVVYQ